MTAATSLLKINGKGWNNKLFINIDKIQDYICASCSNVCCDAVELGCDHDDQEIEIYCKVCLKEAIKLNGNKCPVDQSHNNPATQSARVSRKQILKLNVSCIHSKMVQNVQNMNDNNNINNIGIYDTSDEKEGAKNINNKVCNWNGTLNELINDHLNKCVIMSQDVLNNNIQNINEKIQEINKNLNKQDIFMKLQFEDLKSLISIQQNKMNQIKIDLTKQNNDLKNEMNSQRSEITALKLQLNDLKDVVNKISNDNDDQKSQLQLMQIDSFKLVYSMNDKWDKWDINTIGDGMSINNYVIEQNSDGYNPYSFGIKVISSGIAIWRIHVLEGKMYWFGIVDAYILEDDGSKWHGKTNTKNVCSECGKKGDVICMKLDFRNKTLCFSSNKAPFVSLFDNVNTTKTYKMTISMNSNSKIHLVASKTY